MIWNGTGVWSNHSLQTESQWGVELHRVCLVTRKENKKAGRERRGKSVLYLTQIVTNKPVLSLLNVGVSAAEPVGEHYRAVDKSLPQPHKSQQHGSVCVCVSVWHTVRSQLPTWGLTKICCCLVLTPFVYWCKHRVSVERTRSPVL